VGVEVEDDVVAAGTGPGFAREFIEMDSRFWAQHAAAPRVTDRVEINKILGEDGMFGSPWRFQSARLFCLQGQIRAKGKTRQAG
jgi:hypothetical protein